MAESAPAPDPELIPGAYTLPVWVAAAARAALIALRGEPFEPLQMLELDSPTPIPVVAAAPLGSGRALAVARCEPGDGLDLTRGLVVWVEAAWGSMAGDGGWLVIEAGEGAGTHAATGELCVSAYARDLLERNLRPLVPAGQGVRLQVIFPTGRRLAERTSNAAFGVVEGLALIGTQAQVQRSAAPEQLEQTLEALRQRVAAPGYGGDLVLVIGENGLDLAPRLGLPPGLLLKAGNWLGPVLVAAAEAGVARLLLFGYQGKLIKLAGGIFHTHHHLADGRAEVLTALAALDGLTGAGLQALHQAPTVDQALRELAAADPLRAERLRQQLAAQIEQRSQAYLARYGCDAIQVGAVLFDRGRQICARGPIGEALLEALAGDARGGS